MTEFSVLWNGEKVDICPNYATSGQCGPYGNVKGGTCLALPGYESVAKERSISWSGMDDESITRWFVGSKEVPKWTFEMRFRAACNAVY